MGVGGDGEIGKRLDPSLISCRAQYLCIDKLFSKSNKFLRGNPCQKL